MEFSNRRVLYYLLGFFCVALLLKVVTIYKFEHLQMASLMMNKNTVSVTTMKKELDCMAINIYREAGYEPLEGRIAVAQVTMNRASHPDFPNTICGVVYQKSVVMQRVVCQFSWYCDSVHMNRPINPVVYQESYEVAKKVYLEKFRLDSLKDALYYHANYVQPRWKLEKITQIGNHIFYKQKGGDHAKLAGIQ